MTQEDILRMARAVGGSAFDHIVVFTYEEARRFMALAAAAERTQYEHTLKLQQASYEREIKIEVEAEREKVAHWMRSLGYATGHGDEIEDLLDHLGTQIAEKMKAERAACADICDQHASIEGIAQRCAAEIRARGNK